jgi:hypothetical protein
MSYRLDLTPRAKDSLEEQPGPLRGFIKQFLLEFAESPSAVRASGIAYFQGSTVEFKYDREPGVIVWVSIPFRFGADEATLHIEHVRVEFGG